MKKIIKFFKDVTGEIKKPSEDADKVLDIIRRVIRVALFMYILLYVFSLSWNIINIINMNNDGYLEDIIKYSKQGLAGFIFPLVKSFSILFLYIMVFMYCNKSIKKNMLVNSKLFIASLIILLVLEITNFRFDFSRTIPFLFNLFIKISVSGIIYYAFWNIKDIKENGVGLIRKRIQRISIFGYLLLAVTIIEQIIYLPTAIYSYLHYVISEIKYGKIVTVWTWVNLMTFLLGAIILVSLIGLLIFALIGRKKELTNLRKSSYLLIVIFFVSVSAGILKALMLGGGYLYYIVFALAVSYQNKYKIFDNIGKRTIKKVTEKAKIGFDNYLSFKD